MPFTSQGFSNVFEQKVNLSRKKPCEEEGRLPRRTFSSVFERDVEKCRKKACEEMLPRCEVSARSSELAARCLRGKVTPLQGSARQARKAGVCWQGTARMHKESQVVGTCWKVSRLVPSLCEGCTSTLKLLRSSIKLPEVVASSTRRQRPWNQSPGSSCSRDLQR